VRNPITLFFIASLLLTSLFEVTVVAAQPTQKIPVIIGFKDKSDASLIGKHGGEIKYQYSSIPALACSLPQGAIEALEKNSNIAYIELDGKVQMMQEEPHFSEMFPPPFNGVDRIDADIVHENLITGQGIDIAILDTGIDSIHPNLDDNYMGGYDFVNIDDDPIDDNGHGTLVAGIVAAEGNGEGLIGVAPEASLYVAKVLDATGRGDVSSVIAGIDWAIKLNDGEGVDIISMSLGSTKDNQPLHDICDAAYYNHSILVVAAAGNNYQMRGRGKELDTVSYPARYDSVIAVGATDITDMRAEYSSTGSSLELVAPGEHIKSTMLGNTYAIGSGTSMACPHVSGTAALILSGEPTQSAGEVRIKLRNTADDLGNSGWDSWYGYGLVDANADPGAPTIVELKPPVGAFLNTATPTISATVMDADGINSVTLTLDGDTSVPDYDSSTGLSSYVPDSLDEGYHTAILTVSDNTPEDNSDATSWSFTVDMTAPAQVTDVTVESISSSSLFITWDASTDPDLAVYSVYRRAVGETEFTHVCFVCTHSKDGRAGFFPDIGLEPNTTYYYQVTAWDMAGNEGDPSDLKEGTTVPTPAAGEMHIDRIFMDWWYSQISRKHVSVHAEAVVFVVDDKGIPVPGATVSGSWQGATADSDSGVTNAYGYATLRSDTVRNPEDGITFTFMVDNVDKEGWTYNLDANVETEATITYP
jgi:subtilisin